MTRMHGPVTIFYSYAHEDEALRDELEKHLMLLQRQGLIANWHDRQILGGQEWKGIIDQHLEEASLILLLISPDFLASDYCYEREMQRALERHKQGTARVIPIILRPVYWSGAPFAHLQCLPRDGIPVTEQPNHDAAFRQITEGICHALEQREHDATPPLSTHDRQNRERMLKRVRAIWIEGVLDHSLQQAVFIELGLHEEPRAVYNPWKLEVQETNFPAQPLSAGTRITSVYDASDGDMLILGEPGSGKTTLLLELTRDLLARAEEDEHERLPVVFQLSSWATKQESLTTWLVEELHTKYSVPRPLAEQWVVHGRITPLLDGLDEVVEKHRQRCLDAINAYRKEHPLFPLVVCSRRSEYDALAEPLIMQRAVMIQPLTIAQVDAYFESLGETVASLRHAVAVNEDLQEFATTPLILSILTLTYQGTLAKDLIDKGSAEALQQYIFKQYVERMLTRRGSIPQYTHEQTIQWLTWLATQMKEHNLTTFYIERLHVNWLPTRQWKRVNSITVELVVELVIGLLSGLLGGLFFGLLGGLLVGLASGLFCGLVVGLLSGLVSWVLVMPRGASPAETVHWSWSEIRNKVLQMLLSGLLGGLFLGLVSGLLVGLANGLFLGLLVGLLSGLFFGLLGGLVFGLLSGLSSDLIDPHLLLKPNDGMQRSVHNAIRVALPVGLFFGLFFGLPVGLFGGLLNGLFIGLLAGLFFGLPFGLLFGGVAPLRQHILLRVLHHLGKIPKDYIAFLEYATERILLRRVGGGYMFAHRLLMDYFASLDSSGAIAREQISTMQTQRDA